MRHQPSVCVCSQVCISAMRGSFGRRDIDTGEALRQFERLRNRLHRRLQHRQVEHAHHLHIERIAHRPAGIVVGFFLRVLRRPVLAIEQRIGDARIRLVHAHDIATGSKRARLEFRRLRLLLVLGGLVVAVVFFVGFFRRRHLHRHRRRDAADLGVLELQQAQQTRLRAAALLVGGQHICGRAAGAGFSIERLLFR